MVRVTFSPPSDWILVRSILGVEVRQDLSHVTGIPQRLEECDGNAANQSPVRMTENYTYIYRTVITSLIPI